MKKEKRVTLVRRLAPRYIIAVLLIAVSSGWLALHVIPVEYACVLILTAAIIMIAWWANDISNEISEPLKALRDICEGGKRNAIHALNNREDELGALAQAVVELALRTDERLEKACAVAAAEAEARARRGMSEEICESALPQVLPDIPSRTSFEINGLVEGGTRKDCQFYDYFFIDPGLLCVMLGETPGSGVAEALYMVVAQTTIRSRLRLGRSLEETMTDVNRQLYDLGSRLCLNAFVATLSTADGRLTYVNAGGQKPLFMKNEDRYEWLDSPVYAPLGMNENVLYRSVELRLKQGDRVFMHTAGLGALTDWDEKPYGSQRLQADLNVSRGKNLENDGLLKFISEQALAYCDGTNKNCGFAMLSLLFCKGDKELAHCDVPALAEFVPEVTGFLKKQFDENGIGKRHYAKEAVIVEEVFALCCRKAEPESRVMVECGVAPDGQMVNIRVTAMLGGVNPIETAGEGMSGNAADFIQENADFITFKPGEERDTITLVCFLE